MKTERVRVRFAPSPTGFLHVGGARTALFNWLFARHHGGAFVLRVEDTDAARFKPEFTAGIYDALRWLKLDWDEGPDVGGPHAPYVQSERRELHSQAAAKLVADRRVYECFCVKPIAGSTEPDDESADDEPDDDLGGAVDPGRAKARPLQDRAAPACTCGALTDAERAKLRAERGGAALRFRVDPARAVTVNDVIRGDVTFPAGTIGDFVIVKSDGVALYNFAAVIDDHAMEITHVIRGEEHLANTPKQLLLYEAFGWEPPVMAHLPIILNEQRRKLSKRDGATFVNDYRELGYLPEALVNFLALLGWSPGENREIMPLEEIVRAFTLADVVKHPAIFDLNKLGWMNKEYLKNEPLHIVADRVAALLRKRLPSATRTDPKHIERVTGLLVDRVRTIADVIDLGAYFFTDTPVDPTPEALEKHCKAPEAVERLRAVRDALADAPGFGEADIEAAIRGLAEKHGVKAASFIHPLRVALTGQAVSPGIFEVTSIVGRQTSLARIDALLERLSSAKPAAASGTSA
ncbi:MAG TPA: glutamate--tRNA ligase [Candidatus Eremiobacteraceae bacterium]|nr:glutamate--tRNA ligase [Candidatus Eremiobacteraceae bacterium]